MAGCVAPVMKMPGDSPVSITVLSDARASELGIGDHLIPASQVFVGGSTIGMRVGGSIGGLVPFAIGAGIDSGLNASDLGDAAAASLAVKFNGMIVDALRTEPANLRAPGPRIRIVRANDRGAMIELEPLARFFVAQKPNAYLVFLMNANFDAPGVKGRMSRISYAHGAGAPRPFMDEKQQGWADRGGAPFRSAAQRAYERMTDVFKADLRGELKRESGDLRRVAWESPNSTEIQNGLLLYEQPDYVAIVPVMRDGSMVRNSTLIIDRSQLRAS